MLTDKERKWLEECEKECEEYKNNPDEYDFCVNLCIDVKYEEEHEKWCREHPDECAEDEYMGLDEEEESDWYEDPREWWEPPVPSNPFFDSFPEEE